jgi:hypothetical protein
MLVTTVFFYKSHRWEKNFDATKGKKSYPSVKKYFRCICLNSVGTALSVGRIFSISSPLVS